MIQLKTPDEIEKMRVAGRLTAQVLKQLCDSVRPGVTTAEIDELARELIAQAGGIPVFLNYHGYPAAACISVNDEVIHGIPGERIIQNGDIVSIDVGVKYDGFVGDTAYTVAVGEIPPRTRELLDATREALEAGIRQVRPGAHLSDISHAVETRAKASKCGVVRDFVGHGVGREMHEDPPVPNYGRPGRGPLLKPGMTFAIEPMINLGSPEVEILDDGWTVVTRDGQPSAHFEHTVAVLEDGVDILTLP